MAGIFNSAIFNNAVFNTGAVTPVVVSTGGGAGHPIYQKRKWRETKQIIDEGMAYEELAAAGLPVDVMGEVIATVKPFERVVAERPQIDLQALKADVKQSRKLLDLHFKHVAWQRMLDEEDDLLLMH